MYALVHTENLERENRKTCFLYFLYFVPLLLYRPCAHNNAPTGTADESYKRYDGGSFCVYNKKNNNIHFYCPWKTLHGYNIIFSSCLIDNHDKKKIRIRYYILFGTDDIIINFHTGGVSTK